MLREDVRRSGTRAGRVAGRAVERDHGRAPRPLDGGGAARIAPAGGVLVPVRVLRRAVAPVGERGGQAHHRDADGAPIPARARDDRAGRHPPDRGEHAGGAPHRAELRRDPRARTPPEQAADRSARRGDRPATGRAVADRDAAAAHRAGGEGRAGGADGRGGTRGTRAGACCHGGGGGTRGARAGARSATGDRRPAVAAALRDPRDRRRGHVQEAAPATGPAAEQRDARPGGDRRAGHRSPAREGAGEEGGDRREAAAAGQTAREANATHPGGGRARGLGARRRSMCVRRRQGTPLLGDRFSPVPPHQ